MQDSLAFSHAATALAGTRFRLHGRDRQSGIDCVGLVLLALTDVGRPAPELRDYGLRNADPGRYLSALSAAGFVPVDDGPRPGDVAVVCPGPGQLHLLVATPDGAGLVHAHAGLGRVVVTPQPVPWPLVGYWRLLPI